MLIKYYEFKVAFSFFVKIAPSSPAPGGLEAKCFLVRKCSLVRTKKTYSYVGGGVYMGGGVYVGGGVYEYVFWTGPKTISLQRE